ncbi:kielin/chordin-like protein isoform X1 [Amphibalanus amphitrite]|uniref:kielin/chordin-like protein isoform X1 n=1 Tax=Amphibalanus amphitrite TaxID=1232801 RepID=UPI001C91AA08|nr:kielin/chordin-like protein isoform X1 [Amphibalanus amphitrite]
MARAALVSVVILVTLAVVTPAPPLPHCPVRRLCAVVCKISPQLSMRCEACHPGVCGGQTEERDIVESFGAPLARSSAASNEAPEKAQEVSQEPDTSVDDVTEKPAAPVQPKPSDDNIDLDGGPPEAESASEDKFISEKAVVEEEYDDIPSEGSGYVDDEGPEAVEDDAGAEVTVVEEQSSDEETSPEETDQEGAEQESADTEGAAEKPQSEPEEAALPAEPEKAASESEEGTPGQPEKADPEESEVTVPAQAEEEAPAQSEEEAPAESEEGASAESDEAPPDEEEVPAPFEEVEPPASKEDDSSDEEDEDASEEAEPSAAEDDVSSEDETPAEETGTEPESEQTEVEKSEGEGKKTEKGKPKDSKPERPSIKTKPKELPPKKKTPEEASAVLPPSPPVLVSARTSGSAGQACFHDGVYLSLHSTWFDIDHCNLYVCTEFGVEATSLTGACLPPPANMGNCRRYRLPNQCCYTYECPGQGNGTDGPSSCIDENGVERPHNDDWADDPLHPCKRYLCADGVVVVLSDMRPICPLPPHHGCVGYRRDLMCCNDFNCTDIPLLGCVDDQGNQRDNGQVWYDNDVITCIKYVCNNGTVQVLTDHRQTCEDPVGVGCVAVPVSGRCCPAFTNCSCVYNGVRYPPGAMFPDDPTFPCRRLRCNQNGTISTVEETVCPTLSCTSSFRRPGRCCYECVGCVHLGVRRPEGSMWYNDQQRPCIRYTCTNSQVVEVNRTECSGPPGADCQPVHVAGDCCDMFDCSGVTCPYGDQIYHEGDVWVDNPVHPCKWLICRRSGVHHVNSTYCPALVPSDCLRERDPGECCYKCQSGPPVTCYYQGQTYLEGQIWVDDPTHPCKWFRCRRSGVQQINSTFCPALDPSGCPSSRQPGQCCYSCDTPDDGSCIDFRGLEREDGEIYYTDSERCKLVRCGAAGEQVLVDRTRLCQDPPNENCTVVGRVNCCPQYLCHLMPTSNCTDSTGRRRQNGEIYANDADGCLLVQCTDGAERLLVDRSTLCEPVVDDSTCVAVGVEDCCTVYDCSSPTNCVDFSGEQYADGAMYYDDPDSCVLIECRDGEELVLLDKTERCSDPPENPACTLQGTLDCCPVYSCPNCMFNGTTYPIGSQWWDDPNRQCIRYRCSAEGVVEQVETKLPCPEVRYGCVPVRDQPACCHHKYNCMFDAEHNLIPMTELPF